MLKNNLYVNECKKHRGMLIFIALLLLIETYVVFKIPFKMEAMNAVLFNLSEHSLKEFIVSFAIFVGFSLVQISLFFVLAVTYKSLSNKITASIVQKLFSKIYYSKVKWPPQFKIDEIMQTVNGDAYKLGDNGVKIVFQFVRIAINIIALLFYMSTANVYLAGLIIFNFLIIMFVQNKLNKIIAEKLKQLKKTYGKYAYTSNTFFGRFGEYRNVKAGGYFTGMVNRDMKKYLDDSFSIEKTSNANAVFGMISTLINTMIIMGVGAYMLTKGNITLAVLITFSTYAGAFGGYLTSIPGLCLQFKEFGISYDRVLKIMNVECHEEPDREGDENAPEVLSQKIDDIQLLEVSFSYGQSKKVIEDYSCELEKDNIYCIVGENGTGKTTLINILLGEYEISQGLMELNGQPVNIYNHLNRYRDHVSYCPSTRLLFNDSVKNNILLGRDIEEEKIVEIMKRLNLDKDPELALNREVDMMHGNLSDGQMQKISIVRSILDDKEIMVFDEPEMHLDRDTKKNVMDYLNSIKKDRIIVLISHDGYVAENSDVVIAL